MPEWLKRLLGDPGGPSGSVPPITLEELTSNPLVQDTLFQLIGGRPHIGEVPFLAELLRATGAALPLPFTPNSAVGLDLNVGPITAENRAPSAQFLQTALIHELGHAADFRDSESPLADAVARVRTRWPEVQAMETPSYAQTNPQEHFAETFVKGLDFIRRLNRQAEAGDKLTSDELAIWLEREDAALPGVREAAIGIAQHPLYKDSPVGRLLRGMFDPGERGPEPADATRVSTSSPQGAEGRARGSNFLREYINSRSRSVTAQPPAKAGEVRQDATNVSTGPTRSIEDFITELTFLEEEMDESRADSSGIGQIAGSLWRIANSGRLNDLRSIQEESSAERILRLLGRE